MATLRMSDGGGDIRSEEKWRRRVNKGEGRVVNRNSATADRSIAGKLPIREPTR